MLCVTQWRLCMPKTYIIETADSEWTVYAMDWQDAVNTWGGKGTDIVCIKEYDNRTTETLH